MIQIENMLKSFGDRVLFNNFNLEINDGEFIILSGNSGSGKTTLMNIIGGLEAYDNGNILVDGIDLKKVRNNVDFYKSHIGFLFQNFGLIENKSVEKNLDIVKKSALSGISHKEALKMVGLEGYEKKYVYTLSGGEQQRVAIARLIIKKCNIILADEPTCSLDKKNTEGIVKILMQLNKNEGKTIIMATHDETLKNIGNRLISIDDTVS